MGEQVVLITGAKGGLGTHVTNAFLAQAATVVGVSRSIQPSDFPGDRFVAIAADITQPAAAQDVVAQAMQRCGRIDVLVHVMGGFAAAPLHETDDAAWRQMNDLNLNSTFYMLRAVIPHMRRLGRGRVVAVGSYAAREPHAGLGAYIASKMAMAALVRTVAMENREHGITANVVLPGTMDTAANRAAMPDADARAWVSPQAVAEVIVSLATEASGKLTGALIPVLGHND